MNEERKKMIKFLRAFIEAKDRNILLVESQILYNKATKLLKRLNMTAGVELIEGDNKKPNQ
jgi:hypothetical protein